MRAPFELEPADGTLAAPSTRNDSSAIEHDSCESGARCGRPDCEICEWIKSKIIVSTVDELTKDTMNMLSITLTLPTSTDSLECQIRHLMSAFYRLRRSALWSKSVIGGVRCLHVPYDPIDQSWHPHIHVLAEGWSTEATEIEHRWLKITGGYAIIKVVDEEEHRRNMAWYVSKSPNEDLRDQPERLAEFLEIRARARFQLKRALGNLHGNPLYGRKRRKAKAQGETSRSSQAGHEVD